MEKMMSSHSYFMAKFVFWVVDCLPQMAVFQDQCFIIYKIKRSKEKGIC